MKSIVSTNRDVLRDPTGTRVVSVSYIGLKLADADDPPVEWLDYPGSQLRGHRHGRAW